MQWRGKHVGPSFNEQFDQHGAWRRGFAQQLHALREWLQSQELLDVAVQERLQRLQALCAALRTHRDGFASLPVDHQLPPTEPAPVAWTAN